ncbi:Sugar isomerase (SIS) [Botryosphaeria dothidea]|uniref:Sugar isomerase (SIS) n=1 Tax=Botryosphaeria dothidea TaxID=55169 RepID=A0A8H4N808_9PEZI|nr:Sugar isomerase (SIS) [Botryosphaeria dothidea]
MSAPSVSIPAMSITPPLESFGSPKSTASDCDSASTFDEAASTAASSTAETETTPIDSESDRDTNPTTSLKRKRRPSSALTPPLSATDAYCCDEPTLSRALHVLSTEATALSRVTRLYETSPAARTALLAAIGIVERANAVGGKLVVCGVGKSGLVGRKTVATMKSLGLGASFLHAAEAVHGDLGDVRRGDAVLFISFSGKTAELLNVLPHLRADTPVLALTGHADAGACPLLSGRENAVLLPAPIHESEESSFGVSAPTTSTTVAMAVGDMLALTAAERIHDSEKGRVFKRNHPGGAIGARTVEEQVTVVKTKKVCLS